MTAARRLLVVGPSWVGDMVMANALFRDLLARDSRTEIDVVAPPWSLPLLERMPEVRRGIPLHVRHRQVALRERFEVGRSLAAQDYDQAIILPRSAKSALVPFFARIRRRTGFRGEYRYGLINDIRPFDPIALNQTVKRFRALGLEDAADALPPIRVPVLETSKAALEHLLATHELPVDRPIVAMMPGAEFGPAKQWPVEYFRELALRLTSDGAAVWVFGSEQEKSLGDEIARGAGYATNLCGRTSLVDAVDLLAASTVAVSNDSGLMHVAAAVGVHVIGIYGSSSPGFTPPLTERKSIVYRGIACSPCFARKCPLGHTDCLKGIDVAKVHALVAERCH